MSAWLCFNFHFQFYCVPNKVPCGIVKQRCKKESIQSVASPAHFSSLCNSHSHMHTSPDFQSLPTGVKLLCKAARMGADITESCLCSWVPFHFDVSPDHRNRGHKAWLMWGLQPSLPGLWILQGGACRGRLLWQARLGVVSVAGWVCFFNFVVRCYKKISAERVRDLLSPLNDGTKQWRKD